MAVGGDFDRGIRNILFGLLIFLGIFELLFYFSGIIFVVLEWGIKSLDFRAIYPNFSDLPRSAWPTIFVYLKNFFAYDSAVQKNLVISLVIPFGLAFTIFYRMRTQITEWRPFQKPESLHGDARWASERDLRKIGLRSRDGLLLGKDKNGYLISDGYQHVLLFAPTGSGKGVGFVIPNLLTWAQSVVVHDIKLENFELTSGWRKQQGQEVYLFSPADVNGRSHCYNAFDFLSNKPGQVVDDVQKIANLIMPEQDFWVNEARSLFLGVVLYLHASPDKSYIFWASGTYNAF